MHWFTEQDSKLVVKELPLGNWLMGFFFFLMFALAVLVSFFDKNLPTLMAFFTFPFAIVFFYMLYAYPFITISIDRFRETVSIEKQTLFNYKIFTVGFRELNGLLSISEKSAGKQTTYYVKIPLKDSPKVEKSMEFKVLNRNFHKAVTMMNDYLQKPRNKSLAKDES